MMGGVLKITATISVKISETIQTDNTVHIVHMATLTMTKTEAASIIKDETNDPIIMITDKMTDTEVIKIRMIVIKLGTPEEVMARSTSKFKTDFRQAKTSEITEATTIETIGAATTTITTHANINITSVVGAAMTTITNTIKKKMATKDQEGKKVQLETIQQMVDRRLRKMISRLKDDSF